MTGEPGDAHWWGAALGLFFTAVGTGGVKSCVSSFVGDQFVKVFFFFSFSFLFLFLFLFLFYVFFFHFIIIIVIIHFFCFCFLCLNSNHATPTSQQRVKKSY